MSFYDLFEKDEILKGKLIQENKINELEMLYNSPYSISKKYGYPSEEVNFVIHKYINMGELGFYKNIIVMENDKERALGPLHIGPNVENYLIEYEFKKRTRVIELAEFYNVPVNILGKDLAKYYMPKEFLNLDTPRLSLGENVALDEGKLSEIKEFCSSYMSYEDFAKKFHFPTDDVYTFLKRHAKWGENISLINKKTQEWLLKESQNWKSVKQLAMEYGVSINQVTDFFYIEKRREVRIYNPNDVTNENSYVVFPEMLEKLNSYFKDKVIPRHLQSSTLDSSVGFGNTPNSKMGKSLTKSNPRFLS
ncbi:hypothetical protein [Solibacillus sp. FSL K6-1554]|uniref:hypothetical protein n=1 Tax=Solibacillus sp. FSL K6-1554 TaxID=2921472 RepID=UPI0030F988D8